MNNLDFQLDRLTIEGSFIRAYYSVYNNQGTLIYTGQFIVIIPDTANPNSEQLRQRIRRQIANHYMLVANIDDIQNGIQTRGRFKISDLISDVPNILSR